MKISHMVALGVVLWAWDAHNRSQAGKSAIDSGIQNELAHLQAMNGTNFTNSVWDPVSGQPSYQFGTIDAPGGAGVSGQGYTYSGVFGHF